MSFPFYFLFKSGANGREMSGPFEAGREVPQGSSMCRDRFRSIELIGGAVGPSEQLSASGAHLAPDSAVAQRTAESTGVSVQEPPLNEY